MATSNVPPLPQQYRNSLEQLDQHVPPLTPPLTRYHGHYSSIPNLETDTNSARPTARQHESFTSLGSATTVQSQESAHSKDRLLDTSYSAGQFSHLHNAQHHPGEQSYPKARSRHRWLNSSWIMYAALLVGIAGAIGHHAFYQHLAGRPAAVEEQIKMLRYGAALAYGTKACLIAAVVFAYRQQIWATFRRKALQMNTIDSLFAAQDDLSAFFSLDLWRMAKSALFLAVMCWLFPLVVILTPATLTVTPLSESQDTKCPSVRTLNFTAEATKNWRKRMEINGLPELSLSVWNSTMNASSAVMDPFNQTFFDYYTGPSPQTDLTATLSVYVKKVMPRINASIEICGPSWNCSYTINFVGPGYKCDRVASGRDDNTDMLTSMRAPFTTRDLVPDGDNSYIAQASNGEYAPIQIDAVAGGAPKMLPPFPKSLGALRMEPLIWLGVSELKDAKSPIPKSRDEVSFNNSFIPTIYRCEHYITNYTVQFNHTLAQQFTNVTKKELIRPMIDTTFIPGQDANDGTMDNATATPISNYISPLDVERYRITSAYHTLGRLMRDQINGTISWVPSVVQNTRAMRTRLIDPRTYLAVPDLSRQLQSFYEDIILSLFSNPQFLVVSWAADPNQRSGTGNATSSDLLYPCNRTRLMNKFVYRARDLWIVYALAIVCATLGVAFGAAAIAQNNHHVRTTRFSSIVAATRAPCVDEIPWKSSKWGEVPEEVLSATLRHGIIVDGVNRGDVVDASPRLGSSPADSAVGDVKVYYGFAPEDWVVKSELAATGLKKGAISVLSFRSWH